MNGLVCDACGATLLLDADVRYVVSVEGFAAYDPLEITREDLERSGREALEAVLAELEGCDAQEAQDSVHRSFRFDLCPPCWRRYLRDPLRGARPGG